MGEEVAAAAQGEPVGGAQLPSLPPVGGAPQRHHRWLQAFVGAAVKRRDVFSIIMENRNTATAVRDEALGLASVPWGNTNRPSPACLCGGVTFWVAFVCRGSHMKVPWKVHAIL